MHFSRRLLACISQALSVSILIRRCRGLPQESNDKYLFRGVTIFLILKPAPNDIVRSNGYIIQQCSLFAPHVQEALENLYDVLPLSIWDTHYGTASAPYQAFFKSSYYETLVDHILSSISIGAPLRLDPDNEILEPSLVCALKPDTVIVHEAGQSFDIYDVCRREPTWVVLYYPGTSTIFICTAFFLMPAVPAVGNCPTVNDATKQFEGNLGAFLQSQMYMLLHEIAHFYIGATVEMSGNETMDWNYALSLSPTDATHNALNYVLYVASKCDSISSNWSGIQRFASSWR